MLGVFDHFPLYLLRQHLSENQTGPPCGFPVFASLVLGLLAAPVFA